MLDNGYTIATALAKEIISQKLAGSCIAIAKVVFLDGDDKENWTTPSYHCDIALQFSVHTDQKGAAIKAEINITKTLMHCHHEIIRNDVLATIGMFKNAE